MSEPDPSRPQPVIDAAKLGGLASAAFVAVGGAIFLVVGGVTNDNLGAVGIAIGAAITAVISLVVYLVSLFQGRKAAQQVTPLSDPQDNAGRALVPVRGPGVQVPGVPDHGA